MAANIATATLAANQLALFTVAGLVQRSASLGTRCRAGSRSSAGSRSIGGKAGQISEEV